MSCYDERVNRLGRQKVRVLMNPKSGLRKSISAVVNAVEMGFRGTEADVSYQVSHSVEDGRRKVRFAIEDGVDAIVVAGGDGMVNSIGAELIGTDVALGVIPIGSGNGFARHFGIPLNIQKAAEILRDADEQRIDVGIANGHPFFVTCGMAADAELVRRFEKSPVRGVLPYVFATAHEFIGYVPQTFRVVLDGEEEMAFEEVLIFTVANLTQFGGGARIAPMACPDDGYLEMVVVKRQDLAGLLAGVSKLFAGTLDTLPGVETRRFQRLEVFRRKAGAVQLDGELVEAPARLHVRVQHRAVIALVPSLSVHRTDESR